MSKKIYVTLSDELADDLKLWSSIEGNAPGTIASQLVMEGIREARAKGLLPKIDGKLRSLITRMEQGQCPMDNELTTIAHDLDMDLKTLIRLRCCYFAGQGDRENASIAD